MKQTTDHSEIQQFYNSTTIFLTGVTGFLGKLLFEKLLRLAEIKHIYVLIREKDGESPKSRLDKIYDSPLFDQIKQKGIDYKEKVTAISGNCELSDLGINPEDRGLLIDNVDCVFHLAGNMDPEQNLTNATKANVKSTKEILQLAKEMKNLKCMIYLSSVYAHLHNRRVLEEFYDVPISGENMIRIVDNVEDKLVEVLKEKMIERYGNVYLFTKAIAEDLLGQQAKGLPVAIVRTSFATATLEDPVSGYVQNYNGVTGLLLGKMLGAIRITLMRSEHKIDIVPADYIISNILAAGWQTAIAHSIRTRAEIKAPSDIQIYNCVSSVDNPITWKELEQRFSESYKRQPSKHGVWYPLALNTTCIYHYMLMSFILHTVPVYIGLKACLDRNFGSLPAYGKLNTFLENMKHFTMNEYDFTNEKSLKIITKMGFKDRRLFNFDMHTINWESYIEFYTKGCRVYILNDKLEAMADALKKFQRLKLIHYTTVTVLGIFVYIFVRCGLRCILRYYFGIYI